MMFRRFLRALLALGVLCAFPFGLHGQESNPPFYLHDGDRVVFYGDSITEQMQYSVNVENLILTRFPAMKNTFINSGVGGDTVQGGGGGAIDVRIARDIIAHHPSVMTIMLGMNDGHRQPYDDGVFQAYSQGYLSILDKVAKALPGIRFTLIETSPFDDITRPPDVPGGYNATMLRYGEFVKKTAAERNQLVVDFNAPVNALLTRAYAEDKIMAQQLLPDRVHPSPGANLIMGEALFKAWGGPSLVSQVEIDAQNNKVVTTNETKVTSLQIGPTISWQQLDNRLPYPLDFQQPTIVFALKCSDFVDAFDQETLKITGLAQKSWQLKIDGAVIGNFTADQLGTGINLAPLPTPMYNQSRQVGNLTSLHNQTHFGAWRSIQVPLRDDPDPELKTSIPVVMRAFQRQEDALIVQQRAAAQPVPHKYELTAQTSP